jgi:hypothetical protein
MARRATTPIGRIMPHELILIRLNAERNKMGNPERFATEISRRGNEF